MRVFVVVASPLTLVMPMTGILLALEGVEQQASRHRHRRQDRPASRSRRGSARFITALAPPPGSTLALAMFENEHRSLARHARYLTVKEFVSDKVSENDNGDIRKRLDKLAKSIVFVMNAGHFSLLRFGVRKLLSGFSHVGANGRLPSSLACQLRRSACIKRSEKEINRRLGLNDFGGRAAPLASSSVRPSRHPCKANAT
jgi:hypothetical protein